MAKKIKKTMTSSFKKFKAAWEKDADNPYASIMYYVIAALNIEKDPDLAEAMMTIVVSKRHCSEDGTSPSGLKLGTSSKYYIGQFQEDKNIARSYVGAHWKKDYKFDKKNLTMTVVKEGKEGKGLKIFIQSGGKDNPTPVSIRQNKHGQWKLFRYGSICTGVRKPTSEVDDF